MTGKSWQDVLIHCLLANLINSNDLEEYIHGVIDKRNKNILNGKGLTVMVDKDIANVIKKSK